MHCPKCNSNNIVKNGRTHYGKQRFKCYNCGRQFVESPTRQPIDNSTRELIDKLLLERVSLAAITRVTGVSLRWLQYYVNQKYYQVPKSVEVTKKNQADSFCKLMRCGHM
jgi:transposase-like protein